MQEIKKLSQQVINQIAAGEVVERPASVVKELMENALDAGATQIDVSIEGGGITKIEVKDNGKGISAEDLPATLERYATSKLATTEDLDSLSTYGFRGEALAAISAVSKTTILSSKDSVANKIVSDSGKTNNLEPGSRGKGTTITIENLFSNVPARQKFLKSADTEYRYILKIFESFALLNGKVHFTLTNNNKSVYNLPATEVASFPKERVTTFFAVKSEDILQIDHNEYGIVCTGYVMHPKAMGSTSKFLVVFVNGRPVEDKGIARAIQQGIAGFVPDFYKASAIISITLAPDQVDVNVHPRKTEVKFSNPFRIYSAVTHAVSSALQSKVAEPVRQIGSVASLPSVRGSYPAQQTSWEYKQDNAYDRLRGQQPQFFFNSQSSEGESVETLYPSRQENTSRIPEFVVSEAKLHLSEADITPILGRYIVVGFMDEVWIVDQHAAAERIRYEQFKQAYLDGKAVPQQQLVTPIGIKLSEAETLVLRQNIDVLQRLGFSSILTDNKLEVNSVPTYLQKGNIESLLRDTINEFVDHEDIFNTPIIEDFSSEKNLSLIIATMACHNSVRMNERLATKEARSIVQELLNCSIPYACPHGRRAVWRMSKEEVDRQFMRT